MHASLSLTFCLHISPQGLNIIPGIKVDTGLIPLFNGGPGEKWCRGLDSLAERCEKYYEQGARFAKWRTALQIDVENGALPPLVAHAPCALPPCRLAVRPSPLAPPLPRAHPRRTRPCQSPLQPPLTPNPPQLASGCPTDLAIEIAAQDLARYARICQEFGLVPIVEPEILIDGIHDITTTARVQERVLTAVYAKLQVTAPAPLPPCPTPPSTPSCR